MKGKVKWFQKKKGIGFIIPEDNSSDVFIHYSNIVGDGFKILNQDDEVSFDLVNLGKGPIAQNIIKIN